VLWSQESQQLQCVAPADHPRCDEDWTYAQVRACHRTLDRLELQRVVEQPQERESASQVSQWVG
jgi:hypothetical protein